MALFDQLSGLLNSVMGGNLNEQDTHSHYDQIAQSMPQEKLGPAIGSAMGNLEHQDVQQRVAASANQMSPRQKGGLVGTFLGAFGSSGGNVGSILSNLGIDSNIANNPHNATPEEIGRIAAHAKTNDPSVFQQGMAFYSQHPTLVKALGTVVIAQIARHLANPQA